ncbi:peptidoglycan-binding domain-containing protein [Streptacidiphilus cavernicola]|uniref:Peptidoglycan-binding protein n=1 Tax=Streptacidiphilus cavernicola TaxID=3342716 RepID=A0ABV6W311_9ACTN
MKSRLLRPVTVLATLAMCGTGLVLGVAPAQADPGTVEALQGAECPPNITQGSTNTWCVDTLQYALQTLGFTLQMDGQFGPQTVAAVKWVQTKAHLQSSSVGIDGQVGPVTKAWLVHFVENRSIDLGQGCGLGLVAWPNSGSGTAQATISEYDTSGNDHCTGYLERSTDGGKNWNTVSSEHTESGTQSVTTYAYADNSGELDKVCGQSVSTTLVNGGCTDAF